MQYQNKREVRKGDRVVAVHDGKRVTGYVISINSQIPTHNLLLMPTGKIGATFAVTASETLHEDYAPKVAAPEPKPFVMTAFPGYVTSSTQEAADREKV